MKKSLIASLAAALVFSVAGTSFAASNPFVDVPQGHWAYGYLNQLAKAHMIDGFNDGTFRGDQNMTRYEMATLVAKALAKSDKADAQSKAALEKLQVEFASELQNLGVRVDNLEKKVGNIKLTGDARIRYISAKDATTNPVWAERFRLNMNAQVNDNTSFYGRLYAMNHNEFGTHSATKVMNTATPTSSPVAVEANNSQVAEVRDANFTTKNVLGIADVTVGRYSLNMGQTLYLAGTDGWIDGVALNKTMGKTSILAAYADINNYVNNMSKTTLAYNSVNVYAVEAKYAFDSNVNMTVDYLKNQDKNGYGEKFNVLGLGFSAKVAPDFTLIGDYYKNSADGAKLAGNKDPKAYVARLQYKGVNKSVPGSWGLAYEYLKMETGALPYMLTGAQVLVDNVKGSDVQFSYAPAKNITFDAFYQFGMKKAVEGTDAAIKDRTRIQLNYFF